MTQILSVVAVIALFVVLMPLAVRSMRRRRGGGMGSALMSLETAYRPETRHAVQAQKAEPKGAAENGEPPTET